MSHSIGRVIVDGKTLGFIEWSGTGDRLFDRAIHGTIDEVLRTWQRSTGYFCTCPNNKNHAVARILPYEDLERVWHFGTACVECMAVVEYSEDPGSRQSES